MLYPQELQDRARDLYSPGVFGITRVAEELGVPRTTVRRWVNPSYAETSRARSRKHKRKVVGSCSVCGRATGYHGGSGKRTSTLCAACSRQRQRDARHWTQENVVDAIQRFHRLNGRPPTTKEWRAANRELGYPCVNAVARYGGWKGAAFGSWSEAIRAAGFEPARAGRKRSGDT